MRFFFIQDNPDREQIKADMLLIRDIQQNLECSITDLEDIVKELDKQDKELKDE